MLEIFRKRYGVGRVVGSWEANTRIFSQRASKSIRVIAVELNQKRAIGCANKDKEDVVVFEYRGVSPVVGANASVYVKFPI